MEQNKEPAFFMNHPANISPLQENNVQSQRQFYSHITHNSIGGVTGHDKNKLIGQQLYNRASPGPFIGHQDQQKYFMSMNPGHYQGRETMQVYQADKMMNPQIGFPQMHPTQIMSPGQPMMMQNMDLYQMGGYPIVQANIQQINLGMQYDMTNNMPQSYQVEGFQNQINERKIQAQPPQKDQAPYTAQHPKQLKMFILDLSSTEKIEEFK